MQDHRLGCAWLLEALAFNLPPEPQRPRMVTPQRAPMPPIVRDPANFDRAKTASLPTPASAPKRPADAAYSTEHYAQTFVRPVDAEKPAEVETVSTNGEWNYAAPPCAGWYEVRTCRYPQRWVAHYNGSDWSNDSPIGCEMGRKERAMKKRGFSADAWRGPRLTGEAWPEPAADERTPTDEELDETQFAAWQRDRAAWNAVWDATLGTDTPLFDATPERKRAFLCAMKRISA
jgi:hypothetical protein